VPYNISGMEFLLRLIRLILNPLNLRYRLDLVETSCRVLRFLVIVELEIVVSLDFLLFLA
jgi:hypothetical protein